MDDTVELKEENEVVENCMETAESNNNTGTNNNDSCESPKEVKHNDNNNYSDPDCDTEITNNNIDNEAFVNKDGNKNIIDDKHTSQETNNNKKPYIDKEKCKTCNQFLNNSDIIYYQGHPQNSVEEFVALTNDNLILSSGN